MLFLEEGAFINNLLEEYKCEQRLTKDAMISKLQDSKHKKMIRECVSKITLTGNIQGENILSVVDEDFNVQAISIIEVVVKDKKCISELSKALQKTIKNYVILKFIFEDKQVISFALKRLNKNKTDEIVVDTLIITDELEINDSFYIKYIDYKKILNKSNKVLFYREIMLKSFLISNRYVYSDVDKLLESDLWYRNDKVLNVYRLFSELIELSSKRKHFKEQREMVEVNNQIKIAITKLSAITMDL